MAVSEKKARSGMGIKVKHLRAGKVVKRWKILFDSSYLPKWQMLLLLTNWCGGNEFLLSFTK